MTVDEFNEAVSSSTVLVDFWADWCGPCHAVAPQLEKIASRQGLTLVKVNIDESPEVAEHFGITSIPDIRLFRDGEEVAKTLGAKAAGVIEHDLGLA